MKFEIKDFPPKKVEEEHGVVSEVIYSSKNKDMYYFYTENYGYIFKKKEKSEDIFEEVREKRKLSVDEKEIVKGRIEQKKRNDESERIFIASLPAIQAFEKSMQCGNRNEGQGIGI